MEKIKVLIGSPIRQSPNILREFLESLLELEQGDMEYTFIFVDDNDNEEASRLLQDFQTQRPTILLSVTENEKKRGAYLVNHITHYWGEHLVWKVAKFKDLIIANALKGGYDYLFLVDSDLVLHPATLKHLISTQKDIISEIFWTSWYPCSPELPNVWLYDKYDMVRRERGETLTKEEEERRVQEFLDQLRVPGIYEVGGLGACTLISRKALLAGVSFSEIRNLTLWGEDRHFCVRALALGLSLWVDTHYPAYHIYRESLLAGVEEFKARCKKDMQAGQETSHSGSQFTAD